MRLCFSLSLLMPLAAALAACSAPAPAPTPAPAPMPSAPPPVTTPSPAPTAAPKGDWMDWPIEQGTWVYRTDARGSLALFGQAGADAVLTLRCERARNRVYLSVAGSGVRAITVRTSSTLKTFPAMQSSATPPYAAAEIIPADAILDAMAFSRGRFAIEADGGRSMAIPNWGEVARIVEDCRA